MFKISPSALVELSSLTLTDVTVSQMLCLSSSNMCELFEYILFLGLPKKSKSQGYKCGHLAGYI
jgi:hypothetical protein